MSSTPNALATVVPTALSAAAEELPADLIALYNTLLQNGNDPTQLLLVANELDAVGMNTAAELLQSAQPASVRSPPAGRPSPRPTPSTRSTDRPWRTPPPCRLPPSCSKPSSKPQPSSPA